VVDNHPVCAADELRAVFITAQPPLAGGDAVCVTSLWIGNMTNPIIQEALRHLRRADPIMRDVIRRAGPFTLQLRRDRFSALVYSILGQQISGKAASAIRARLVNRLKPQRISATSLASLSPEELRAVGVSLPKARYLLDLADRVAGGHLRLDRMGRLTDEGVIEALTQK
jgi:DNA-3-methyladenine glycosylase II